MIMTAPSRPSPAALRTPSGDPAFGAWALATAAAAFLLLFAGGMVASTGSERGHRLFAGCLTVMTVALSVLASRPGVPDGARAATLLASGAIILQGLLGGLAVLLDLAAPVSIVHACLGQAVFCLLAAAAALASPGRVFGPGWSRVFRLSALGFAAAYLQAALGAYIKHAGGGLAWHVLWSCAVVVLAASAVVAALRSRERALLGPAAFLATIVPLQLLLGLAALRARSDSAATMTFLQSAATRTVHLTGGSLSLLAFLLLALRSRRTAEAA